jgi:hypothetical protein
VPIPDDERFERYLRQFRPVAAEPLPLSKRARSIWRWWVFVLSAAAALAVLVASVLVIHFRRSPAQSPSAKNMVGIEQVANAQPLTLGRANHLLAHAPSFKAALDGVAFQRQRNPLSEGTRSALASLSKEDIKLWTTSD